MSRFVATFTALVIMISAIVIVSAPVMGRQIETTQCSLSIEEAALRLTGDVANAVYMTQVGDKQVIYEGPEVIVTGRRDIVIYDREFSTPNGRPLMRGRSHKFDYFRAFCTDRPEAPFRWRLGGACKTSFSYVSKLTGNFNRRAWEPGRLVGDWHYGGKALLSFWVPKDLRVLGTQGVTWTPGYKVEDQKNLYISCTSDYWRSR